MLFFIFSSEGDPKISRDLEIRHFNLQVYAHPDTSLVQEEDVGNNLDHESFACSGCKPIQNTCGQQAAIALS